jgi:hypothetical protein
MPTVFRRSSVVVLFAAAVGGPCCAQSVDSNRIERADTCAAYGAGFVAVEGTQTCVRVGGHVRVEMGVERPSSGFERSSPLDTPRVDWNSSGVPPRVEGTIPAGFVGAQAN